MTKEQFMSMLVLDGFPEPTLVQREAGGFLDAHTHPFEVQALVLSGQIDLVVDGVRTAYISGEVFRLLANQVHTERYGSNGVQYLASRKNSAEVI
ncbi:cupin [Polynucleobacter sp. Adler-ghost]|jgi:quercetin dioxygenase-like cupin family protein|nr:cupin [Polynucleobacter sp. Adler-ghost]